jgi:hypothetical protein
MNPTSKKFIALFLVFSLLMINCATLSRLEEKTEKRKKHGANLIIQKINGQQVRGELITVKPNSILLLNTEGRDVSVGIADIKVIRIVKKSKALLGAGIGLVVGVCIGALVGLTKEGSGFLYSGSWTAAFAAAFGICGIPAGALIGGVVGIDKTIQIEGMTDLEIREALNKLRKKARIRDYK